MKKVTGTLVALGLTTAAACSTSGEGGPSITDMLIAGTANPPPTTHNAPRQPAVIITGSDVYCPNVGVIEGGTAIQAYAGGRVGDAAALRSQFTLGQLARECFGQPDGSTLVKVGVEGRAVLGAGGAAGRYEVPVRVVVKRDSTIIANRVRRMAVTIPAGETQGSSLVVEEGIIVPPADVESFEIEVGLGSAGAADGSGRRRRG
jgi:hypothetical protein